MNHHYWEDKGKCPVILLLVMTNMKHPFWLHSFPIKHIQVETCSCSVAFQTVWLIIGSKVKTFQGGKSIIIRASTKKENMAHSRDWWELHPYSPPPKEETDTWQAKKCALFPKMTFPPMSLTAGPKQLPVSRCNESPTASSLDTLGFCFTKKKKKKTNIWSCWNMKPFYNKMMAVSHRND